MQITHGMILAAGLGARMRPLTLATPKPMIELAGTPLLGWHMQAMRGYGVSKLVVNTHYLAEQIQEYVEAMPQVTALYEAELLETGGGIRHALPQLGEAPFVVANSDALCIDPQAQLVTRMADAMHKEVDAVLTLVPREHARGYDGAGDFTLNDGELARRGEAPHAPYVFTGLQLLHPRAFVHAPEGAFSMNVIYNRLLAEGRITAVVHDGDWLHIGDPDGLAQAEAYLVDHREVMLA